MAPEDSGWLRGLADAAARAVELLPKSQGTKYQRVGDVTVAPERGPGWFRLSPKAGPVRPERLEEAVLAPEAGPDERRHSIIESLCEGKDVWVRTGDSTPTTGQSLWTTAYDKRAMAEALRDSLRNLPADGLASRFESRELDVIPQQPLPNHRVTPEQHAALRACCAPGLQLVWGPPGTGKTHVIVEAIRHLLDAGWNVLLVSNTNIAVDNAVEKLAMLPDLPAGRVVRVGTPAVKAVAQDDRIALPRLIQARQQELQSQIAEVEDRIVQRKSDPRIHEHQKARRRLADFDVDGYQDALIRAQNRARRETVWRRRQEIQAKLGDLQRKQRMTETGLALARWSRLRCRELDATVALEKCRRELSELESLNWWSKLSKRTALSTARRRVAATEFELTESATRRREYQAQLSNTHGITHQQLPECVPGDPTVDVVDQQIYDLKRQSTLLADGIEAKNEELRISRVDCAAADTAPMPVPDDPELIAEAERLGIPRLIREIADLERAANTASTELAAAIREYEELQQEAERQRRSASAAIIDEAEMIATTVAMLSLNKAVRSKSYDFVFVDEAAACRIPDVVHSVGHAKVGAVLVGDYLQNGPIIEEKDEAVNRYFTGDCFAHFDVTNPAAARALPGCVVLTEQRRFGRTVTDLVNNAIYGGILRTKSPTAGEVVFIDVDGLSANLTDIHRSGRFKGQWAIGALLARSLAELHVQQRHEGMGVVVPYKSQQIATEAFLKDSSIGPETEVGTAHAFQGREFDVVLFDMVEDGQGQVAAAAPVDIVGLGGLRLFNVAVTRARKRVYLLGQGAAVSAAAKGPLGVVRDLIASGAITVVRAAEVLGIDEAQPPSEATAGYDLWEALSSYVRVIDLYDQVTTVTPLLHRFEHAKKSIWIWSPWAGVNQELQNGLVEAAGRGVSVTAITLPLDKMNDKQRDGWRRFQSRLDGRIIHMVNMHQKIVIIDDRLCFVGSMNLLSSQQQIPKRRKELMMEVDSVAFADFLSRHERVPDLSESTLCPDCGQIMKFVDTRGPSRDRRWFWRCSPGRDGCRGRSDFRHDPEAHTARDKIGRRR